MIIPLRSHLELLAADWYRTADALDPPGAHDESVTDSGEAQDQRGYADGLRQAAHDLLVALGKA